MAYLYVYTYDVPIRMVSDYVLLFLSCGGCASSYSGLGSFGFVYLLFSDKWILIFN
jgi:hypothetical protein